MRSSRTGRPNSQAIVAMALGIGLVALIAVGQVLGWWGDALTSEGLVVLLQALIFLALGVLILWKAGGNRVGWVFAYIGLSIIASGVAGGLAARGYVVADAIGGALWLSWIMVISLLIAWFPTGRVSSPRWRWLQWVSIAGFGAIFILYVFTEDLCARNVDELGCVEYVKNPIGITGVPNPEYGWIGAPLFVLAFVAFVSALVSLVMRYRRSNDVARLQIKWFLLATSIFVVAFALQLFMEEGLGIRPTPWWVDALVTVSTMSIPLSATVAILRYRLYDIDRIISRTVAYAVVVGLLAGVVALMAAVVGTRFDNPLIVAGTTLAVAAIFNPLRKRVQKMVDRRFNRSRYDAEAVVFDFTRSLRDEVDADELVIGWTGVVATTMQPSRVGVWVKGR